MISTDLEVLELEGKTLKLTINPADISEATSTAWDCKIPNGEEHKIPILSTCPPAPGPKWLLDSLSVKKKASKKKSRCQPNLLAEDFRASDDALDDHIVRNFKRTVEEIKRLQQRSLREKKHSIISPLLKVDGRRS